MEVNKFASIDPNVDLEKILPIHQKRIITFINHFISNTVSFLNSFAQSCESRFMDFEYKIHKVEASLLILESQLSSIPNLDSSQTDSSSVVVESPQKVVNEALDLPEIVSESQIVEVVESVRVDVEGLKACEDSRFRKFFKMVQFGVPPPAVKLKMEIEGVDPSILDKPNEVIPGYTLEEVEP